MEKIETEKTVRFSAKLTSNSALSCSSNGTITFLTGEIIYLMKFDVRPSAKQNELEFITTQISVHSKPYVFDVGIAYDTLQKKCTADEWNILVIKKLVPLMSSSEEYGPGNFVRACLSPAEVAPIFKPLLATLTSDGRLALLQQGVKPHQYTEVDCLSDRWLLHMTEKEFAPLNDREMQSDDHTVAYRDYTAKLDILTAVDIAWSEPEELSNVDSRTLILVTAMRSGHIVSWRVTLPLAETNNVSVADAIDTTFPHPVRLRFLRLKWCGGEETKTVLTVGFMNGLLQAYEFAQGESNITWKLAANIWNETDMISIGEMTWCDEAETLAFCKGPYLVLSKLKWKDSGLTFSNQHIFIGGAKTLTNVFYQNELLYVGSAVGYTYCGKINTSTGEFTYNQLSLPYSNDGKQSHGLCVTPNSVYLLTVQCPCVYYDHLTIKEPLEVHVMRLKTIDDVIDCLLKDTSDRLTGCLDYLSYLKCNITQTGAIPQELLTQCCNFDSMDKFSPYKLRLARYIQQLQLTYLDPKPESEGDVATCNKNIAQISEEIVRRHVLSVTSSSGSKTLSDSDKIAFSVMKQVLEQYSEAAHDSIRRLSKACEGKEKEVCVICQTSIPFSNVLHDSCPNGHKFGRCCKTLLLCQHPDYRKCVHCGVLALSKSKIGICFGNIRMDECTFCDGKLA